MIHTCGTFMTNFVHDLPKENVDWLPRCVKWGIFIDKTL